MKFDERDLVIHDLFGIGEIILIDERDASHKYAVVFDKGYSKVTGFTQEQAIDSGFIPIEPTDETYGYWLKGKELAKYKGGNTDESISSIKRKRRRKGI